MVDPYPIPNGPAASVVAAIENVRSLNKPIIMVPQAFGGGEGWARTPTAAEERIMTYLGIIHGAVGVQYFVRNAPIGFPYAASAWSEIRQISVEVLELAPAILNKRVNITLGGSAAVHVGAWEDLDGSIVVMAANTNSSAMSSFSIDCQAFLDAGYAAVALEQFGSFDIPLSPSGLLRDTLRPFATSVYRLSKKSAGISSDDGGNLVYNGGYEICGNPSVPDGNYVGPAADSGATFFADSRVSKVGRHSLILRAPSKGNGTTMSPYRLSSVAQGKTYKFSVWIKGDVGASPQVAFTFGSSVWTNATTLTLAADTSGEWTQHSARFVASSSSGYGWVSYSLVTAGRVWLDELSVIEL